MHLDIGSLVGSVRSSRRSPARTTGMSIQPRGLRQIRPARVSQQGKLCLKSDCTAGKALRAIAPLCDALLPIGICLRVLKKMTAPPEDHAAPMYDRQ